MNWDALGAIAELVGSAAVIITLVYLSIQLKHSAQSARLASSHQLANTYQEWLGQISNDQEMAELYARGLEADGELTKNERLRFDVLLLQMFRATDAHFQSHVDGVMKNEMWEVTETGFRHICSKPGGKASWERQKQFVSRGLRGHIEKPGNDA